MNRLFAHQGAIARTRPQSVTYPSRCRLGWVRGMGLASAVGLLLTSLAHPTQAQEAWRLCRQLGEGYQEIYAFPTPSYYINICELNGEFYYIGQSRQTANALQLPARPISRGTFFAERGSFNYAVNDLRDKLDSPNQFELIVTRESLDGEIEILRREYSIPPYVGEDPTTMCDPVVEPC